MSKFSLRKIKSFYEAEDGSEPELTVEVETVSRGEARICDDLDELGIPKDEQRGFKARVLDAYWEAEHSEWLQSPEGEASGK